MAPAPGDVWRVSARLDNSATNPPQCSLITWWCQAVGMYSGPQDLGHAWVDAFHPILLSLPNSLTLTGLYLKQFAPSPGPTFEMATPAQHGAFAGFANPTDTAVEILKKSGLRGRHYWGRTYLPWSPVAWIDTSFSNQLDPIAATALHSRLTAYHAKLLGPNVSGTSWLDGVYGFRSHSFPPAFSPANQYEVFPEFRSVGRRGRRAGSCPPFPSTHVPALAIGTFGNGVIRIWPGPGPPITGDLMCLTHWNAAWPGYPVPPAGWTTPGNSTVGWDGLGCQQVHNVLDLNQPASFGWGWDWPVNGGGGGPSPFPFAGARYSARTSPINCSPFPNPGGNFDTILFVRDFSLENSPIFAAELRCSYEQGLLVYVNGFLVVIGATVPSQGPHVGPTVTVDVSSFLVPNAVNRLAFQQFNNNVDVVHNPALWNLNPPGGPFYNDYPFACVELNVIQEPI